MAGKKNIEKWSVIEKCIFFLLEKSQTKSDLASFVYGKAGPNVSRLSNRLLKPHENLFNTERGRKAWKKDIYSRQDDRVRVVSIDWDQFLSLWEERRKKVLRFNNPATFTKTKELVKQHRYFLFKFKHYKSLFTIKRRLYLPSVFGLIDTAIFYGYFCGGHQTPEEELPYYLKRTWNNRENFRALFKLYYFLRVEQMFPNMMFSKLFSIISKNEEMFFKRHTKLHRKLYGKKYQFNAFFNYIDLISPSVIEINKRGELASFGKILGYGINVHIDKKFIEDKIKKTEKSIIPQDKINVQISFEEFLPTFGPLMGFKAIFD